MPNANQLYAIDEQTGRVFEIRHEERADRTVAILSIIYLIVLILFFLWQLFDIWVGKFTLARIFGYINTGALKDSSILICIYTFIGGALGGIVNEIRAFLYWHCDNEAYGRSYLWKALVAPWLGGTLGIFVYFLTRSGIALFTGEFVPTAKTVEQSVPMFTIGVLAGYGSRKVFVWLDTQVNRLLATKKDKETSDKYARVPSLIGMSQDEAKRKLEEVKLRLGDVSLSPTENKNVIGKVIRQSVKPELWLENGAAVDITVGTSKAG